MFPSSPYANYISQMILKYYATQSVYEKNSWTIRAILFLCLLQVPGGRSEVGAGRLGKSKAIESRRIIYAVAIQIELPSIHVILSDRNGSSEIFVRRHVRNDFYAGDDNDGSQLRWVNRIVLNNLMCQCSWIWWSFSPISVQKFL